MRSATRILRAAVLLPAVLVLACATQGTVQSSRERLRRTGRHAAHRRRRPDSDRRAGALRRARRRAREGAHRHLSDGVGVSRRGSRARRDVHENGRLGGAPCPHARAGRHRVSRSGALGRHRDLVRRRRPGPPDGRAPRHAGRSRDRRALPRRSRRGRDVRRGSRHVHADDHRRREAAGRRPPAREGLRRRVDDDRPRKRGHHAGIRPAPRRPSWTSTSCAAAARTACCRSSSRTRPSWAWGSTSPRRSRSARTAFGEFSGRASRSSSTPEKPLSPRPAPRPSAPRTCAWTCSPPAALTIPGRLRRCFPG